MAVPEQIPVVNYVADGIVKKFDVPFEYDQQSDLHVYVDGAEPTIDKYYFDGNAFNFYIAPTSGQAVKVKRITPKERDTDYNLHTNTVRPKALNTDFDRLWYVLQEVFSDVGGLSQAVQDEIIARIQGDEDLLNQLTAEISARMLGDEAVTEDLKNYVDQVIGAIINDPDFDGIDAKNVNDASGQTQQQLNNGLESVADMLAIANPQTGYRVYVKSYHAGLNKGGGTFVYDATKSSINDGGMVINGWVRQYTGLADIFMFGASGYTYEDPNIDDTVPIQRAIDTMRDIYIPEGRFKCNLVFTNSFNIRGAGKGSMLYPYDAAKPVMTNINRSSLGWNNDTVMDLEIRSLGFDDMNFTGIGFQFGLYPAQEGYEGVGRIVMRNVRIMGFDKGINKVNGNIGNKYYDCSFEYNKYHVYGKGNQLSLGNPNAALMHCGCDYFYGCNFSESTIAAVAYYDTSGGSGQWAFDSCVFQFNHGFAWFFEFDLPNGLDLFAPITSNNTWFESNARDTVVIDRLDGTTASMQSKVRSVIGADAVVMTVTDEFNTRVSVGLANPQSQLHIHDKETPTIQLTSDLSGNDSPNLGAVIYHNTQDLYLENKQTGIVYILNQNGRVELNASGDLTSNKGKIGYGYGAGDSVTQTGNKDTTVTCNKPSGRIITSAQSLGAGASISFILNNSYIEETDVLIANVRYSPSNSANYYDIKITNVNAGACQVNIKNTYNAALSEAIHISFCIVKGSINPMY